MMVEQELLQHQHHPCNVVAMHDRRMSLERQRRRGVMAGTKDSPRIELLDTQGRITEAFQSQQTDGTTDSIRAHRLVTRTDDRRQLTVLAAASRKRKNSPSRLGTSSSQLTWSSTSTIISPAQNGHLASHHHVIQESPAHGLREEFMGKWREKKLSSSAVSSSVEMMENSETESAKDSRGGSMESETHDVSVPMQNTNNKAVPTLQNIVLSQMSNKEKSISVDHLSEEDIENKFNNVALAIKTDKLTIKSRLQSHQRQRDIAEKNIESEHSVLKNSINEINHTTKDQEARDKITKILHHLDIFMQSVSRLSSKAEIYGSVQQEEKIGKMVDIVLQHSSNLAREKDKAQQELFDAKLLLSNSRIHVNSNSILEPNKDDLSRKDYSPVRLSGNPSTKSRRASLAALPRAMYDNVMVGLGHLFPSSQRTDHDNSGSNLRVRCLSATTSVYSPTKGSNSIVKGASTLASSPVVSRKTSLPVVPTTAVHAPDVAPPSSNPGNQLYKRRAPMLHKLCKIDSMDSIESNEENNNRKSVCDANVADKSDSADESSRSQQSVTGLSETSLTESVSSSPLLTCEVHDEDVFATPALVKDCYDRDVDALDRHTMAEQCGDERMTNDDELWDSCDPCKAEFRASRFDLFSYARAEFSDYRMDVDWKQVANFLRYFIVGLLLLAAVLVLVAPFSRPLVHIWHFFTESSVSSTP